MIAINQTHDINLKSWIESANDDACDFPIQNLPFCVFEHPTDGPTIGVGIGDKILNLRHCANSGLLPEHCKVVATECVLNGLMTLTVSQRSELRAT